MSEQRTRTVLLIPSSVTRSGVERGDPLAVLTAGGSRSPHGVFHWPERAAGAGEAEPDSSQPVAADPQTLDTETDGDYGHVVESPHSVEFEPQPTVTRFDRRVESGETQGASWTEETRLAFLARPDPRSMRPAKLQEDRLFA